MLYTVGGKKQICIEKVVARTTTNAKSQVWKSSIILYCPGRGITAFLPFLPELSCKLFVSFFLFASWWNRCFARTHSACALYTDKHTRVCVQCVQRSVTMTIIGPTFCVYFSFLLSPPPLLVGGGATGSWPSIDDCCVTLYSVESSCSKSPPGTLLRLLLLFLVPHYPVRT